MKIWYIIVAIWEFLGAIFSKRKKRKFKDLSDGAQILLTTIGVALIFLYPALTLDGTHLIAAVIATGVWIYYLTEEFNGLFSMVLIFSSLVFTILWLGIGLTTLVIGVEHEEKITEKIYTEVKYEVGAESNWIVSKEETFRLNEAKYISFKSEGCKTIKKTSYYLESKSFLSDFWVGEKSSIYTCTNKEK